MTIQAIVFDIGGVLEITPDPRIYALTCERLGRQPAEVIFLDDREPAIDAARQAGMHGVLFKNNSQAIADIHACIQANAL